MPVVNMSAEVLPVGVHVLLGLIFLLVVFFSCYTLNVSELKKDVDLQHRVGFATVMLVLIWSLRAGVSDGLGLHFYFITCFHLMFGWQTSIVLVCLVQVGMIFIGVESVWAIGANGLTSGVIPILSTYCCWLYVEKKRLFNPFAFIFLVAFGGAIAGVLMSAAFVSIVFLLTGAYDVAQLKNELWLFLPLIALPEGVLNGMVIAGLVVFKPDWVKMFDEKKYMKS